MTPLGIGVCMLFAGTYRRWANLLIWASLAASLAWILNSVRIEFRPTTLWQLITYIVLIASDGGLMFRGARTYDAKGKPLNNTHFESERVELRREIEELKSKIYKRGKWQHSLPHTTPNQTNSGLKPSKNITQKPHSSHQNTKVLRLRRIPITLKH